MPRRKTLAPKMYLHGASGHWCVTIAGKRHYLGKDRPEAERQYRAKLAEHLAGTTPPTVARSTRPQTVGDVATAYLRMRSGLVSRSQLLHYTTAADHLAALCGDIPAREFGASHMRALRDRLITLPSGRREGVCVHLVRLALAGGPRPSAEVEAIALKAGHSRSVYRAARQTIGVLSAKQAGVWVCRLPPGSALEPPPRTISRRYALTLLGLVRSMWRRLASEGLVSQEAAREVCGVMNPEQGIGRLTAGRLPPDPEHVQKMLAHLSPPAALALCQVQRLTGARPGELCSLSRGQVSTGPADPVTIAVKGRRVRSAAPPGLWLYAPVRHKTQRHGQPRVIVLGRTAQEVLMPYLETGFGLTGPAYRQAITRACKRAGVPPIVPHALRHEYATAKAQTANLEDLRAQLGHSDAATTQHYIADLIERASRLAEG